MGSADDNLQLLFLGRKASHTASEQRGESQDSRLCDCPWRWKRGSFDVERSIRLRWYRKVSRPSSAADCHVKPDPVWLRQPRRKFRADKSLLWASNLVDHQTSWSLRRLKDHLWSEKYWLDRYPIGQNAIDIVVCQTRFQTCGAEAVFLLFSRPAFRAC